MSYSSRFEQAKLLQISQELSLPERYVTYWFGKHRRDLRKASIKESNKDSISKRHDSSEVNDNNNKNNTNINNNDDDNDNKPDSSEVVIKSNSHADANKTKHDSSDIVLIELEDEGNAPKVSKCRNHLHINLCNININCNHNRNDNFLNSISFHRYKGPNASVTKWEVYSKQKSD